MVAVGATVVAHRLIEPVAAVVGLGGPAPGGLVDRAALAAGASVFAPAAPTASAASAAAASPALARFILACPFRTPSLGSGCGGLAARVFGRLLASSLASLLEGRAGGTAFRGGRPSATEPKLVVTAIEATRFGGGLVRLDPFRLRPRRLLGLSAGGRASARGGGRSRGRGFQTE
jgi:hypothetical protein